VNFVNQGRRRLFDQVACANPFPLRRGRTCARGELLAVYLGEHAPPYTDPRQRPLQMYFPDLPASPYFDRKLFGWADALEGQTAAIREELSAVLSEQRGREAVFHTRNWPDRTCRRHGATEVGGYYFYHMDERARRQFQPLSRRRIARCKWRR